MSLCPEGDSLCMMTQCFQELKSTRLRSDHQICPCTGDDLWILDYHSFHDLLDLSLFFFNPFFPCCTVQIQRKQNVYRNVRTLQLRWYFSVIGGGT